MDHINSHENMKGLDIEKKEKVVFDTSNNVQLSLNTFFIEKYEKREIEYLLSLEPDEFLHLVYDKSEKDQDGNNMTPKDYIKYLRKLLSEIYENDCEIKTFYKTRANNRLYCAKSAQAYQYKVRGFLLSHTTDYDMSNCHPRLVLYLCKKYNIYCPQLSAYCENRDEFLQNADLTKYDILKAINTDKNRKKKDNYIYNSFIQELIQIKENIMSKSEIKFNTENQKNPISSKLNRLLCYYENLILNRVIAKYKDLISVLMFDGFMATSDIPIEELNILSAEFGITWTIKQHDKSIEIPSEWNAVDLPFYSYQKNKFEQKIFLLENQRLYYQKLTNGEYQQINRMDLKDYAEEFQIISDNGKKTAIFQKWLQDKDKRQYEDLVFDPSMKADPKKYLNTFDGFAYKDWDDSNNKNIDSFRKLICNLCNYENNVVEYMMNYLAHIIQKPAEKSGKIVVFRGIEGVGKDSFHLLIQKILGFKYCLNTENFEDIFGKYNIKIKNKIFITLNETNADDGRKYKDSLKAFATADKTTYADKCVKAVEQNNYARLFLFTNASSPVNLEMTSRRYVIIKTSWELVNDTDYWNEFYKNINDKEYIKSVYNYLKNRDLSEFKINNTPVTEEYKTMKENSIHPIVEYLKELCQKESHPGIWEYDEIIKSHIIKRNEFMYLFEEYFEEHCEMNDNLLKKKVITNAIKDIGGVTVDKQIKRDGKNQRFMVLNFPEIKSFYMKTKML